MNIVKIVFIMMIQQFLKIFFLFPIRKNRIVMSAYSGKQYSCNPKYITNYLLDNYKNDVEIIWAFNDVDKFDLDSSIKKVKFKSIKFIYYILTAAVVVDNVESWSILPKRKGQLNINTWHGGGAYKGVGLMRNDSNKLLDKNMVNKNKRISLYISSCKVFTKMTLRDSFLYTGEVLECGMPRNDLLINNCNNICKINEIKKKLNVSDFNIILYAPTFRNDKNYVSTLDYERLLKICGNNWKVLYRGHYYNDINNDLVSNVIDVSNYPDMQELLLASNILITDYSSSMWDFSLMHRPVFLYADDLDLYNDEREFYTPINSWPFPLARNNDELEKNIVDFNNDDYISKVNKHHEELGNTETGKASKIISDRIIKFIKRKGK